MTADNSASIHFVSKDKAKLYKQPEWKSHKPCIVCGELFLPYQKRSVVCSQDCRLVHVANNSRAKWQTKDYPEINCRIFAYDARFCDANLCDFWNVVNWHLVSSNPAVTW